MLENQICTLLANRNVNPAVISEVRELCSNTVFGTLDTIGRTLYESPVSLNTLDADSQGTVIVGSQTIDMFTLETTEEAQPEATQTAPLPQIGRYDDLGVRGKGGMGEVRKIRDRELNRSLAMKIIHENLLSKTSSVARFIEEGQVGAQLQHPNIVPVHEMGRLEDGRFYFTMQEIRGREFTESIEAVHAAVKNQRWWPTEDGWNFRRLIDVFHKVCSAIAYSHSKGVIHRDLKPENIMIGSFGEVLVVDWGIAKVVGRPDYAAEAGDLDVVVTDRSEEGHHATRVGQVAGTPAYMAPEMLLVRRSVFLRCQRTVMSGEISSSIDFIYMWGPVSKPPSEFMRLACGDRVGRDRSHHT